MMKLTASTTSSLAVAAVFFAATTPSCDAARAVLSEMSRLPAPLTGFVPPRPATAFVTAAADGFQLEDKPFRVIGANNYWCVRRRSFFVLSDEAPAAVETRSALTRPAPSRTLQAHGQCCCIRWVAEGACGRALDRRRSVSTSPHFQLLLRSSRLQRR